MCYLSMNVPGKALDDANSAVELDRSYIKGYYRKAMSLISLNRLPLAKEALLEGLKMKPNDKELSTQLQKVMVLMMDVVSGSAPGKKEIMFIFLKLRFCIMSDIPP